MNEKDIPMQVLETYDLIEKILSPEEKIFGMNRVYSDAIMNALLSLYNRDHDNSGTPRQ